VFGLSAMSTMCHPERIEGSHLSGTRMLFYGISSTVGSASCRYVALGMTHGYGVTYTCSHAPIILSPLIYYEQLCLTFHGGW